VDSMFEEPAAGEGKEAGKEAGKVAGAAEAGPIPAAACMGADAATQLR
jgi:hypothetical protein